MRALLDRVEETAGAAMTYAAAGLNVGIATWLGSNWFLVLSAIAVLIRIAIDGKKLYHTWFKKKKPE